MRISDWSSDVCSSDLKAPICHGDVKPQQQREGDAAVKNAWDDEVHGKEAFGGIARRSSHDVLFCALGFEDERADRIDDHFEQGDRSGEHTSELQSLMRISYAVFCLKKNKNIMS